MGTYHDSIVSIDGCVLYQMAGEKQADHRQIWGQTLRNAHFARWGVSRTYNAEALTTFGTSDGIAHALDAGVSMPQYANMQTGVCAHRANMW